MDFHTVDTRIAALERCILAQGERLEGGPATPEPLLVGVDLGTAYIVVVALDQTGEPVACALESAQVVKDGLVVDYAGASRIVRRLVERLEAALGRPLGQAAIAVPPGTGVRECATHRHVVESAGLEVVSVLDEPTAANAVLRIDTGVIVDIGGGTTGLSILENGTVIYVADEATGGTHLSLVLAGNYHISFDDAEALKKQSDKHREILPIVRPVLQKMASIINRHIQGRETPAIYLVGGTCCLAEETGKPVYKPANPFLVTPLGIALNCFRPGAAAQGGE